MKLPLIHTTLVIALIVSIGFLISLSAFNLVVLNKMDKFQEVLEIFPDQSHFSKLKRASASKVIEEINQKSQVMVTAQTIGFIILCMQGIRLGVLLSCIWLPKKGSKFSFMRRAYEEINSVFENTKDIDIVKQEETKV